jgi:redox-sensitive bicupin YhaK (pirin superfamily)
MGTLGDVGSTKLFENDKVILWEFVLEPGEKTPLHTHKHDYVWYVLEGTTLEVFDKDDKSLYSFEAPTGAIFPLCLEGDELVTTDGKGLRAPATHSARNRGPTRYREILVETKK